MSENKPRKPLTKTKSDTASQVEAFRSKADALAKKSSSAQDLSEFLQKAEQLKSSDGGQGRLIFALDATMSRQPTWDRACSLQAQMFDVAGSIGSLAVQLVYFRGFAECRASKWVIRTEALRDIMTGIDCRGGQTQIRKVLAHALKETKKQKVSAVVFVGDAMEEDVDLLCHRAGQLSLSGVPVFMFQEGHDNLTERAYREIARLSNGAYMRFDSSSARELADLLRAVAAFAAGGRKALSNEKSASGRKLLEQLR